MTARLDTLPKAFIWRRLHSLTGMWLVLFLLEHLITNSQAALLLGESGKGFVRAVNFIHNLPYLTVIEVALLGVPIFIHLCWGIKYARTAKPNSMHSDGSKPHLKYSRNRAYTWQRITSWILVVLLILHIVKFRFLEYPHSVNSGPEPTYFVKVTMDPGLYTVANRLGVTLYNEPAIACMQSDLSKDQKQRTLDSAAETILKENSATYSAQDAVILQSVQQRQEKQAFVKALSNVKLKGNQVVAAAPQFGTASLLTVRDTFKSPWWGALYTVFVVSACFHAFNGLWTSMLTWGWVIREAAQTKARKMAIALMVIITFLGLAAVWGTYFLNLKN